MYRGKRRQGLTILEKQQICRQRLEPGNAKKKLSEFGKQFPDKYVSDIQEKYIKYEVKVI